MGRPTAIMPFEGQVDFGSILQVEGVPPQKECTEIQAQNILDFKKKYKAQMDDPGQRGKYMVIDVSRSPTDRTTWGSGAHKPNRVQCLTASGPTLHAFALGEGSSGVLSVDRKLHGCEHGRLQGFPSCVIDASVTLTQASAKKAFGNAMSIPVIGSVIARELRAYQQAYRVAANVGPGRSPGSGSSMDASGSANASPMNHRTREES